MRCHQVRWVIKKHAALEADPADLTVTIKAYIASLYSQLDTDNSGALDFRELAALWDKIIDDGSYTGHMTYHGASSPGGKVGGKLASEQVWCGMVRCCAMSCVTCCAVKG